MYCAGAAVKKNLSFSVLAPVKQKTHEMQRAWVQLGMVPIGCAFSSLAIADFCNPEPEPRSHQKGDHKTVVAKKMARLIRFYHTPPSDPSGVADGCNLRRDP